MAKLPCAYCKTHKCELTYTQVRLHKCLQKQCTGLEKLEHKVWRVKAENKAKSAERRKQLYGTTTDNQ